MSAKLREVVGGYFWECDECVDERGFLSAHPLGPIVGRDRHNAERHSTGRPAGEATP